MMRGILVDDEPMALEVLEAVLSKYDEIELVGSYLDPKAALENLDKTKPDVVFLDIEMGPVNGLEIADDFTSGDRSVEIVFVTAYSEYAIKAFEINAIDYILKPPQKKRLDKTIQRLREGFDENRQEKGGKVDGIKVSSFGVFNVTDSLNHPLRWRTKKAKELFVLLLMKNKMSKDLILEIIFPDKDLKNANTLLHTTVYQLRKTFSKLGFNDSIFFINGEYVLNLPVLSDFNKLDKILSKENHMEEDIEDILEIYQGDFLEYEGYEWALSIQQKYKESIRNILLNYANIQMKKDINWPRLRDVIRLINRMEPFNEDIATLAIEYLGKLGERDKLKIFYEEYKDNLWDDLHIKPNKKTLKLYEKYYKMK